MRLKSVLRYVEERLFLYSWKATVLSADAFACCLFIGATSLAGHFKHNIEIILLVETTSRFPMWFPFIWNYLPPPPPDYIAIFPKLLISDETGSDPRRRPMQLYFALR